MEKIDFVFLYVNGADPEWIKQYNDYCRSKNINKRAEPLRFRSWGFLKFFFRGIDKFLPWINNVYMVVSSESQVPEWVDKSKVKIVLHKDIIPERFLPTFNSTAIEMFLKNIPGLSEKFIYSNDDFYFLGKLEPHDFFDENNYPKIKVREKSTSNINNQFRKVVLGCQKLVLAEFYKNLPKGKYYKPEHLQTPMLKSTLETVYSKYETAILNSVSAFREVKNYNQYIYTFYQFFSGKFSPSAREGKYMDFGKRTASDVSDVIKSRKEKAICINDNTNNINFENAKTIIQAAFKDVLPDKSKYEI